MILRIFPEGSLAESVTTTVWIGVWVLTLFNLRFGWTLSGLVVPGYLAPLMIVKPASAVVILLQGVLAYALVWIFSERLSRRLWWSNCFGRDRFFALVLASILVKTAVDGYLVPLLAEYVESRWQVRLDLEGNLHSFGLIIVALIANQFWKPGLLGGLGPFGVMLGVTYLIVRYPLMYLTNFSIGNLEYMYEQIATSILASPKAYVILVTTAFLASRMNLIYSWDYNGILIPALLALQWYAPMKILTSFVEAWVVFVAGSIVLETPMFRESTIEGARKILLFFNISFAYKFLIGHATNLFHTSLLATDLFGFGYLLPSLMAMKMHDKGISLRLTRTTLQTSFVGALAACGLGFVLATGTEALVNRDPPPEPEIIVEDEREVRTLAEELKGCGVQIREQRFTKKRTLPTQGELEAFVDGLRALKRYQRTGDETSFQLARGWLAFVNYRIGRSPEGLLFLEEREPCRGWGMYVLNPALSRGLLVQVPAPAEEWAALEAGAYLFQRLNARALAVSTLAPMPGSTGTTEILGGHRTFFHAFHDMMADRNVVQVRGYTQTTAKALFDRALEVGSEELDSLASSLWVKSSIPPDLRLTDLQGAALDSLDVHWYQPRLRNAFREHTASGYADLFLSRNDRRHILAKYLVELEQSRSSDGVGPRGVDSRVVSLRRWVLDLRAELGQRSTDVYVTPSQGELLYLDEEVYRPLAKLVFEANDRGTLLDSTSSDLAGIQLSASLLDYQVTVLDDGPDGGRFVMISEIEDATPRRYWGTQVFRLGGAQPFIVEVPHPLSENTTFEAGLDLFDRLDAMGLVIAGAHSRCNRDQSSDVVLTRNKSSVFNLVNQVLLRDRRSAPLLVVQVRALGPRPGLPMPREDAVLALCGGKTSRDSLDFLERRLVFILERERLQLRIADGDEVTSGYEAEGSAQAQYLTHTRNKGFASLWLSPSVRVGYRTYEDNRLQKIGLATLGIPTEDGDLWEFIRGKRSPDGAAHDVELMERIVKYQQVSDIRAISTIRSRWPHLQWTHIVDGASGKPFLVATDSEGRVLPLVASLAFRPMDAGGSSFDSDVTTVTRLSRSAVRRFVDSDAAFLCWEAEP